MIRRLARRLVRGFKGGPVILLYHRVAVEASDPWGLSVSPRHFAEHLEVLKRRGPCLSLDDFVAHAAERRLPRDAVALTFDDGYADNLHVALPLLERAGVPATIFVVSGAIGSSREFWWDELERLVLQGSDLPATFELELAGSSFRWSFSAPAKRASARDDLYFELWRHLQPRPAAEQRAALDALADWAGRSRSPRRARRPLDSVELGRLACHELISIGAHTVHHVLLPAHSVAKQCEEIVRSKADLQASCGRPIKSFAYPYGGHTAASAIMVGEAGFEYACAAAPGRVRWPTGRYALPRVEVGDWHGEDFARHLQ